MSIKQIQKVKIESTKVGHENIAVGETIRFTHGKLELVVLEIEEGNAYFEYIRIRKESLDI